MGIDDYGKLGRCAPLLFRLLGHRYQLALLLSAPAPVVEGLLSDPHVPGDLGHALPVRWAHPLTDGGPGGPVLDVRHGSLKAPWWAVLMTRHLS
jgi:hypothetical protein